jgi:hypothetical protein
LAFWKPCTGKERVELMLELLKSGNNSMEKIETLAMLYIFS